MSARTIARDPHAARMALRRQRDFARYQQTAKKPGEPFMKLSGEVITEGT